MPLYSFCNATPTPEYGPFPACGWYTQWAPLEKINFLFAIGCQLHIASWLGIGSCVHFFQCWGFMSSGLNLCRLCACCCSLWVYMFSITVVYGRNCLLGVIHPSSLDLRIFLSPLPHCTLSLEGRGLNMTPCLGVGIPKTLIPCTMSSYGSLC